MENDRVYDSGAVSVSVAYVVALPPPTSDRMTIAAARAELDGARNAQQRANANGALPQIRLLVADIGPHGERSQHVRLELTRQRNLPNRLIAISGLGHNHPAAIQMIRDLDSQIPADQRIPVFGSRPVVAPDPYGVGSSRPEATPRAVVAAEVAAALDATDDSNPVLVIRDDNPGDPYVNLIGDAADDAVRARSRSVDGPVARKFVGAVPDAPGKFDTMVRQGLCDRGVRTVYFAGRATDLVAFLQAVADRGCGTGVPVTVLTGDDAVDLVTALRTDPEFGRGENRLRSTLQFITLRYTPAIVAPRRAETAFDEAFVAISRPAECARRVARGVGDVPTAYGPAAITTGRVIQECLTDPAPPASVPVLQVAPDGRTAVVNSTISP